MNVTRLVRDFKLDQRANPPRWARLSAVDSSPYSLSPPRYDSRASCLQHSIAHGGIRNHAIQECTFGVNQIPPSSVDSAALRSFPQSAPMTIGTRRPLQCWAAPTTPAPELPQPPTLPTSRITIGSRQAKRYDRAPPGLGTYSPAMRARARSVNAMNLEAARSDIWVSSIVAPPPGTYDPIPPLGPPKKWGRSSGTQSRFRSYS
jgi:hypothetical protein